MGKFKKFDLVYCRAEKIGGNSIHVVLLGPLDIPYFLDGVASDLAFKPLDPTDPAEWANHFKGYVVFDLYTEDYHVFAENSMRRCDEYSLYHQGCVPFDNGTGRLRVILGLIRLAEKWWGGKHSGWLDRHLKMEKKKDTGSSEPGDNRRS